MSIHFAGRIAATLFVLISLMPHAGAAPSADNGPKLTPEEMGTAMTLAEAVQVMGNLRGLPGGCPAAGQGLVELRELLAGVGIPSPDSVALDGWGNPILGWCRGTEWAVLSTGLDGRPAGSYGELPEVPESGDDFVLFGDDRAYLPAHVETVAQGGKQKRTMADIRSIAIVLESYKIDNDALPGAPTNGFEPVETLRDLVQPIYIRELPEADGWGNPIWVWTDGTEYRIVSAGRDGVLQHDYSVDDGSGATSTFDSDIVFGDGIFSQWPEGPQL